MTIAVPLYLYMLCDDYSCTSICICYVMTIAVPRVFVYVMMTIAVPLYLYILCDDCCTSVFVYVM